KCPTRTHWNPLGALGLRISVAPESRFGKALVAGPEAGTDLLGIHRIRHNDVGARRRRSAPRKAGVCQAERSEEKLHERMSLTARRTMRFHSIIGLHENAVEALGRRCVVGRMRLVAIEANRIGYFDRHRPNARIDAKLR